MMAVFGIGAVGGREGCCVRSFGYLMRGRSKAEMPALKWCDRQALRCNAVVGLLLLTRLS